MRELQKARQLCIDAHLHGLRASQQEMVNRFSALIVLNAPINAPF